MKALLDARRALRKFHEDEDGLEALQVVMIVAIAALCLILIRQFWGTDKTGIQGWFISMMEYVMGTDDPRGVKPPTF